MEDFNAISEEFLHLLVIAFEVEPLMKRTIAYFFNEDRAREMLEDEFDRVSDFKKNFLGGFTVSFFLFTIIYFSLVNVGSVYIRLGYFNPNLILYYLFPIIVSNTKLLSLNIVSVKSTVSFLVYTDRRYCNCFKFLSFIFNSFLTSFIFCKIESLQQLSCSIVNLNTLFFSFREEFSAMNAF